MAKFDVQAAYQNVPIHPDDEWSGRTIFMFTWCSRLVWDPLPLSSTLLPPHLNRFCIPTEQSPPLPYPNDSYNGSGIVSDAGGPGFLMFQISWSANEWREVRGTSYDSTFSRYRVEFRHPDCSRYGCQGPTYPDPCPLMVTGEDLHSAGARSTDQSFTQCVSGRSTR